MTKGERIAFMLAIAAITFIAYRRLYQWEYLILGSLMVLLILVLPGIDQQTGSGVEYPYQVKSTGARAMCDCHVDVTIEQINWDGNGNNRRFHRYPHTSEIDQTMQSIQRAYNMEHTRVMIDNRVVWEPGIEYPSR